MSAAGRTLRSLSARRKICIEVLGTIMSCKLLVFFVEKTPKDLSLSIDLGRSPSFLSIKVSYIRVLVKGIRVEKHRF